MAHYHIYDNLKARNYRGAPMPPDLVQILIDRPTAIRWLVQIANSLDYPDDGQPLQFAVYGELKLVEEE